MEFGPNAWGWFFCPVVNLWRPTQVVRELWIMADRESLKMTPPHHVFALWWGCWIVGNIASRIVSKMEQNAEQIDVLVSASWGGLITHVIMIAAGVGALLVVGAVSRREQAGWARAQGREPTAG